VKARAVGSRAAMSPMYARIGERAGSAQNILRGVRRDAARWAVVRPQRTLGAY